MKKNFVEVFIKYRSLVGTLCLLVLLYSARPSAPSITIGFFLILGGTFFRAWSSGHINKDNELATGGPYALTRNPLYFGNFLLGLGIAVAGNTWVTYAIFLAFYLMFFPFLMVVEHRRMKKKFGEDYEAWSRKSNSFFPKIKSVKGGSFNISYYMKNREYRVLFFSLFVVAVLVLKYLRLLRLG